MEKIRILFNNKDQAGINFYRTLSPALELEKNHNDDFFIEINPNIDFDDPATFDYLKSFNIIHYHRNLVDTIKGMQVLSDELKKEGVVLIMDIDDYWELSPNHPQYRYSVENNLKKLYIENIKFADYVTTTTELLASEIKKISGKNNVIVFENSIDPINMTQFQNNWKPDPDGKIRITYMGGSSHLGDLEQIKGVVNALNADYRLKDKFKINLAGWDTNGSTTEVSFNEEMLKELQGAGLWTKENYNLLIKSNGNIDMIKKLPDTIANKYRGNVFISKTRSIEPHESVYYLYEKILTDNHKIIKDKNYIDWLNMFQVNGMYPQEDNYCRRWTKKANTYANVLNETDIVIAPLENNKFNTMKSNLKQVECWSRKLPIVCTDVAPYNVDGINMHNCALIPPVKNSFKEWTKVLKKLILDEELRKELGQNLYDDFKDKYDLTNVTNKRADFYKSITNGNN